MKKLLFPLLILMAIAACKEGQLIDNLTPETTIFVDSIKLSGDNRLNSVISMHWSGEDQDGFVKGYELSFDEMTWDFVTVQDSVFRFSFDEGTDTTDIDFWVRSIDDEDLADPSPAYVSIPIKNTPPVVKLDTIKEIPDTVYSVFSVLWKADDIDGIETIDSIFIRLNTGPWFSLPRTVDFVTIVPTEPDKAGSQKGLVYTGTEALLAFDQIDALVVDGDNQFYVQAMDITGALSEIDSSETFFIKRQGHDLLVIDDHSRADPDTLYAQILSTVYGGYDFMDLRENLPPFWNPSFSLLLQLYDKVFWYSDGSPYPLTTSALLLENAANAIQVYLNESGKIMITMAFPSSFNDPLVSGASAIFGFSPADSLSSSVGQARIVQDSLVNPVLPLGDGYPTLLCPKTIAGADPFYSKSAVNDLYAADITSIQNWVGPETVCGRTTFVNGETNQIFFSVELHRLNGDPQALESFFDKVINQEFAW